MAVLFILNPAAGKGRAKDLAPVIEKVCKKYKKDFDIRYTKGFGDGILLSKKGIEEGFERIISVGGDGTLNEVINGAVGSSVPIGVVPGGSGNDFIRSINSCKDIEQIIYDNLYGKIMLVDLGKWQERYFINVASAGFDAEVVRMTKKTKKIFSGSIAYLVALIVTIFTYKGINVTIKIDDQELQSQTLLIAIANGRYYGGGMLPTPQAQIHDGQFDVCHIQKVTKLKMLALFPKFIKGKHGTIPEVTFLSGEKVTLNCNKEIAINIDGEILTGKSIDFEIVPQAIPFIMPTTSVIDSHNEVPILHCSSQ